MKEIQNPYAALGLAAEFGTKGGLKLQLDEVVVPVAIISQPSAESQDPRSTWRKAWSCAVNGLAGAGNFQKLGITNPVGSGVVVLVDEFRWANMNAVADTGWVEFPNTVVSIGLSVTGRWRDSRAQVPTVTSTPTAVVEEAQSAAAVLGTDEVGWAAAAGTSIIIPVDCLLYPGCSLLIRNAVANLEASISVLWRERPLQPGELAAR